MRAVKRKLKSQRGASITFALLIFLVAAVVGSAVLTAGTAASGRMSKIAEMDQRYYSVNSAAKLVIDQIQKDEIYCEKKEFSEETPSDIDDDDSTEGEDETPVSASDYTLTIKDEDVGEKTTLTIDAVKHILEMTSEKIEQNLSLVIDNLNIEKANLSVNITETIYKNGDLDFIITNSSSGDEDEKKDD